MGNNEKSGNADSVSLPNTLLSEVYIPVISGVLPLPSNLLSIRHRGYIPSWSAQRGDVCFVASDAL